MAQRGRQPSYHHSACGGQSCSSHCGRGTTQAGPPGGRREGAWQWLPGGAWKRLRRMSRALASGRAPQAQELRAYLGTWAESRGWRSEQGGTSGPFCNVPVPQWDAVFSPVGVGSDDSSDEQVTWLGLSW